MAQDKPKRRFALTPTSTNSPAAVRGFGGNSYGFAVTERRFFGSVTDDVVTGAGGAYTLIAASGAYVLSGVSANLLKGKILTASAGAYTLNGVSAGLYRAHTITANAGAYSYTGVAATITYTPAANNYVLTANAGSYAIAGSDANLVRSKLLIASSGTYSLAGVAANVVKSKRLVGDGGAYALAGNAADIVYTPSTVSYTLTAGSGTYALSGNNASFNYAGGATDTHDGYWTKQWLKRKPKRKDLIEAIQENPIEIVEAIAEVKQEVTRVYPNIDYNAVKENIKLQQFIATQILEALQRQQDEDDEIEALFLLM